MMEILRNIFVQDFWLKLFSLVLAVLLWLTISFAREGAPADGPIPFVRETRRFSGIPITVQSSAGNVRDCKVTPSQVDIRIEGDARSLKSLQARDIRVILDLTEMEAAHDLRQRLEVLLPAGLSYSEIVPAQVQVIFPPRN